MKLVGGIYGAEPNFPERQSFGMLIFGGVGWHHHLE
jgi:hypothetical protein